MPEVSSPRVLVAEDDPALAHVVQFNLERHGFRTTHAANGRLAWEEARRSQYEAVVTDQQMPELMGIELCRNIRTLPNYDNVPLILLTAKGMELDICQLKRELSISALFPKPFSPASVVRTLSALLVEQGLCVAARGTASCQTDETK